MTRTAKRPRTASRGTPRPPGKARRGRPRAIDVDRDTEAHILEAARRVFLRRGSAGSRMHEIAAEAGVNSALLHYYFRSKDALARAVFREAAARLFPVLVRILTSDAPFETRIEQAIHHYIDVLRENPFLPGYVLSELHYAGPAGLEEALSLGGTVQPTAARDALAKLDRELVALARARRIRPIRILQFFSNLASLCVFPFAARPMFSFMLGVDDTQWEKYLNTRRTELPRFFLSALRP